MTKKTVLIALLLLTVMAVAGYALQRSAADAGYRNITPAAAKERLDSGEAIILLDVRTAEENTDLRIPGSLLIPVQVLEAEAPSRLPDRNTTIFIYCRSGRRSVTAAEILVELGYTGVYNLGGIIDWPYETESE